MPLNNLALRIRELFGKRAFWLVSVLIFAVALGAKFSAGVRQKPDPYERVAVSIADGATYSTLMTDAGIAPEVTGEILTAASTAYDLATIRAGDEIELLFPKGSRELAGLVYGISDEKELRVKKENNQWLAEVIAIAYEIRLKTVEGTVESSLYEAGLAAGMDDRTIMNLAEAFQWTIDFAMDPRQGDTFKVLYEQRYLDGAYAMPGRILAGIYVNDGTPYELHYFKEANGNEGYFDQNGNSVQKIFLRAPLEYKYISSGYTTGPRYIEKFEIYSPSHRSIDYAANYGTPIRATGDGIVTFVGWSNIYGNQTTIRHNATYSTRYGHQSKIIVKKGQRMKQGQVIGYVGSTGISTGNHLDYGMQKNGVWISPLREVFPPGKPISPDSRDAFAAAVAEHNRLLQQ